MAPRDADAGVEKMRIHDVTGRPRPSVGAGALHRRNLGGVHDPGLGRRTDCVVRERCDIKPAGVVRRGDPDEASQESLSPRMLRRMASSLSRAASSRAAACSLADFTSGMTSSASSVAPSEVA